MEYTALMQSAAITAAEVGGASLLSLPPPAACCKHTASYLPHAGRCWQALRVGCWAAWSIVPATSLIRYQLVANTAAVEPGPRLLIDGLGCHTAERPPLLEALLLLSSHLSLARWWWWGGRW
jgi:hypothetical protein